MTPPLIAACIGYEIFAGWMGWYIARAEEDNPYPISCGVAMAIVAPLMSPGILCCALVGLPKARREMVRRRDASIEADYQEVLRLIGVEPKEELLI